MVETHTRILGIAPYDGMRTAMEQAAQAYPNVELEVYTGDLEEGQAIVQSMTPNSYDCIISRGGTATLIRQVTDLPVVDIHISVYDVLRTMKLAENYTSLYAIVGFPSITEPAHTLCSLLNFDLDILTVRSAEEVRHTLERLKQGGYRMVVCDMVTHTIAREMGFDAFLITSGIESLHSAIDQAVNISTWFGQLRQENLFLRSITQEQGGRVVVMEPDGSLFYNNMKDISPELHRCLQTHLREIPATGSLKFYYTERSQLYSITAQVLLMNNVQRYLFYCVPSRIPLHSSRPGLRSLNQGECEYLFSNSFYSLSGAMGTQDAEINALAAVRQPLFICGEPGTGKEQIARYLYLHSALVNRPLVVANCAMMNDKSWDFLLNHYNSPLNANGNTVYFQNFEAIPEHVAQHPGAVHQVGKNGHPAGIGHAPLAHGGFPRGEEQDQELGGHHHKGDAIEHPHGGHHRVLLHKQIRDGRHKPGNQPRHMGNGKIMHQLFRGRVLGHEQIPGILRHPPGAVEHRRHQEPPEVLRAHPQQRGHRPAEAIENHGAYPPPQLIRQGAAEQRPDHLAGEKHRGHQPNLRGGKPQGRHVHGDKGQVEIIGNPPQGLQQQAGLGIALQVAERVQQGIAQAAYACTHV